MLYSKKSLTKMLEDNDITPTTKSIAALLLICLDNGLVTREEVLPKEPKEPKKEPKEPKELKEPKPRGRPRKYPPKEVDPNKATDPKYHRLRTIRTNPISVKLTNVDTGEATSYSSLYKASRATHHGCGFFIRNNGKLVDGIKIEVDEDSEKYSV